MWAHQGVWLKWIEATKAHKLLLFTLVAPLADVCSCALETLKPETSQKWHGLHTLRWTEMVEITEPCPDTWWFDSSEPSLIEPSIHARTAFSVCERILAGKLLCKSSSVYYRLLVKRYNHTANILQRVAHYLEGYRLSTGRVKNGWELSQTARTATVVVLVAQISEAPSHRTRDALHGFWMHLIVLFIIIMILNKMQNITASAWVLRWQWSLADLPRITNVKSHLRDGSSSIPSSQPKNKDISVIFCALSSWHHECRTSGG